MWECPVCGNHNSDEYCDNCGKRHDSVSESKEKQSSNRWTINDLAIIVLTIAGAIILLTTSLVKIPYLEEYIRLNNLAFGNWNDYITLSTVFQYFEKAGWILLLMKVAAVALYATIIVSLIETVKKLTTVSQILRWVSVGIGLVLVITMTWVKSKINQDPIASIIAGNLKYGYGGILLGLLFLGTAVFLSTRKNLLNIDAYEFGATIPLKSKEFDAAYTEREYDTVRTNSPFEAPISTTAQKPGTSDTADERISVDFNNGRNRSLERNRVHMPTSGDSDKVVIPGKLKSTLRTSSRQPFENDEAASLFKRPDDL